MNNPLLRTAHSNILLICKLPGRIPKCAEDRLYRPAVSGLLLNCSLMVHLAVAELLTFKATLLLFYINVGRHDILLYTVMFQ